MGNSEITWDFRDLKQQLEKLDTTNQWSVSTFVAQIFFPRLLKYEEVREIYESKLSWEFPQYLWHDENTKKCLKRFFESVNAAWYFLENTPESLKNEEEASLEDWLRKAKREFREYRSVEAIKELFQEGRTKDSPVKFKKLYDELLEPMGKRLGGLVAMWDSDSKEGQAIKQELHQSKESLKELFIPENVITSDYIRLYRFWCLDEKHDSRRTPDHSKFHYWVYSYEQSDFDLVEIIKSAQNVVSDLESRLKCNPLELRMGRLWLGEESMEVLGDLHRICKVYLELLPNEKLKDKVFIERVYGDENTGRKEACKRQVTRLNENVREAFDIKSPFHFGDTMYRNR